LYALDIALSLFFQHLEDQEQFCFENEQRLHKASSPATVQELLMEIAQGHSRLFRSQMPRPHLSLDHNNNRLPRTSEYSLKIMDYQNTSLTNSTLDKNDTKPIPNTQAKQTKTQETNTSTPTAKPSFNPSKTTT
jgi:hypothetical protein